MEELRVETVMFLKNQFCGWAHYLHLQANPINWSYCGQEVTFQTISAGTKLLEQWKLAYFIKCVFELCRSYSGACLSVLRSFKIGVSQREARASCLYVKAEIVQNRPAAVYHQNTWTIIPKCWVVTDWLKLSWLGLRPSDFVCKLTGPVSHFSKLTSVQSLFCSSYLWTDNS